MALFIAATSATPTFAAKGHGGGTTSSGTSSLTLVLLNSTDGLPHWGQQVTFNVSTTATTEPYVTLYCYQNGKQVYSSWAGFYPSYPWPWNQVMTLSSLSWTGGAADCTATLSSSTATLKSISFHVYP